MKNVSLADYQYELPNDKIAKYPLKNRSHSKLLVYRQDNIGHHTFEDITQQLPGDSLLIFNNTRVIPARIHFHKATGAKIEVFLLEPVAPATVEEAMSVTGSCTWQCMIGNAKRWHEAQPEYLQLPGGKLIITRLPEQRVKFEWEHAATFAELVQDIGKLPLPPYIKRAVEAEDEERYQTVYSEPEGAVAAPTAGLHFTEDILEQLLKKGVRQDFLTLHVSAGTFQPINADDITAHPMHQEEIIVTRANVENLLHHDQVIAVGTTSLRTLESLYWYGVKLAKNPEAAFKIEKLYPYEADQPLSRVAALKNVLDLMKQKNANQLVGHTEIFIFPGYEFRIVRSLITNFHLPGSTLVLLIAAFIGADWRKVYESALNNEYRFLSYGDSSLLIP